MKVSSCGIKRFSRVHQGFLRFFLAVSIENMDCCLQWFVSLLFLFLVGVFFGCSLKPV